MTDLLTVYGTNWCSDSRMVKRFLESRQIAHHWIDIDADKEAKAFVIETNKGYASTPTMVFPDGKILVEPSLAELKEAFPEG